MQRLDLRRHIIFHEVIPHTAPTNSSSHHLRHPVTPLCTTRISTTELLSTRQQCTTPCYLVRGAALRGHARHERTRDLPLLLVDHANSYAIQQTLGHPLQFLLPSLVPCRQSHHFPRQLSVQIRLPILPEPREEIHNPPLVLQTLPLLGRSGSQA